MRLASAIDLNPSPKTVGHEDPNEPPDGEGEDRWLTSTQCADPNVGLRSKTRLSHGRGRICLRARGHGDGPCSCLWLAVVPPYPSTVALLHTR